MKSFGEHFGQILGQHIKDSMLLTAISDPVACVFKCLLESKHAQFTIEYIFN
jgi:hypothetical protein